MGDRTVLGPADVTDEELVCIAAASLDLDAGEVWLLGADAEVLDYPLDALFTAGRFWVHGQVGTPAGPRDFRVFVKHVQAWSRSPLFRSVPERLREVAAALPWRSEVEVYRSDLRRLLPAGLTMPRALAVHDLDPESAAIWLEEVPWVDVVRDRDHLALAARLLGRLAASRAVAADPAVGHGMPRYAPRDYLDGRLRHQVLPLLADDAVWRHPLVAGAFDDTLRRRLSAAADSVEDVVAELELVGLGNAHGDACSNNLLVVPGQQDLVLLDYGFWCPQPLGFDLGQFLVGDVQLGRRPASDLGWLDELAVGAYVEGLRDEGCLADLEVVRRAHALQVLVYTGLSSIPLELLGSPVTPESLRTAQERAATARAVLDLVERTAGDRLA